MGTTSSAPPGSSTLPSPSRPEGPARSCPLPSVPPPALASAELPAGGEARGPNDFGVPLPAIPLSRPIGRSGHRAALGSSLHPGPDCFQGASPPAPGAALPPRPPGRTLPGSRARPLSVRPLPAGPGMRLDRGGGADTRRTGRHDQPGRQAGGPSAPGLGFF